MNSTRALFTCRAPHRRSALVALLLLGALSGCASNQQVQSQLTDAETSFDAGNYEAAYEAAVAAETAARGGGTGTAPNPDAASAAYIAGLSAYRMGRMDDAREHLNTAVRLGQGELAGRAHAQRAAVNLRQNSYLAAAEDYDAAASLLTGDDARKAREQAESARRVVASGPGGGLVHPTGSTGLGVSMSTTPRSPGSGGSAAAALPAARLSWTLQAACFRDRDAAERQARSLVSTTGSKGIESPRVVPQQDPALGTVYCIWIGEFATKQSAEQARDRLGRSEYYVRKIVG